MITVTMMRNNSGDRVAQEPKPHTANSALGILARELAAGGEVICQTPLKLVTETRISHVTDATIFDASIDDVADMLLLGSYLVHFEQQAAAVAEDKLAERSRRQLALDAVCLTLDKPLFDWWHVDSPATIDPGDFIAALELVDEGAATLAEALALA